MTPTQATAITGKRILFLGAHCDDIEIGCGGTANRSVCAAGAHSEIHMDRVV